MNTEEIYFWRVGLSDEPLEEEREAMTEPFKNITPRLSAEQILNREARFVERGMAGYETMQAIRRASRMRSVAERRRQRQMWLLYGALAGVVVGLLLVGVLYR